MRVLLVPNTANQRAVAASQEFAVWCAGHGLELVLESVDARETGLESHAVSASDIGTPVLAVAVGGDGTILKAVHLLGDIEVPLLGVKYGRLGFLSGTRPETMREAVESALAGEARIERRATLSAKVVMEGRTVGTYRALNEVVVSRGATGRVIALDVHVDGTLVQRHHADGMIVATATGSTAYALSAGGPVVAPGFGGMLVVALAPHTLQSRAIVTDPCESVEISLPEPLRADACITVDGDVKPCRQRLERVIVNRSDRDVLLVKHDGHSFYETAATQFYSDGR